MARSSGKDVYSEWSSGNLVFKDKSGNEIFTVDGDNRKVTFPSGSVLDVDAATTVLSLAAGQVGAASLSTNLKKGYIPLPLGAWRKITSNEFGNIAVASGNGGHLANDTTPILQRINAATDKKARISWAATVVDEIQQDFVYPPDLDDTAAVVVNLIVYKNQNMDASANIGVAFFEGVGDTNAGGNTAAITETAAAQKTVSIAAGDVGAYPKAAAVTLTPSAHANDAVYLLGAWIEYTRKD